MQKQPDTEIHCHVLDLLHLVFYHATHASYLIDLLLSLCICVFQVDVTGLCDTRYSLVLEPTLEVTKIKTGCHPNSYIPHLPHSQYINTKSSTHFPYTKDKAVLPFAKLVSSHYHNFFKTFLTVVVRIVTRVLILGVLPDITWWFRGFEPSHVCLLPPGYYNLLDHHTPQLPSQHRIIYEDSLSELL